MQPAPLAENVGFGRRRCRLSPRVLLRRARGSLPVDASSHSRCAATSSKPHASRVTIFAKASPGEVIRDFAIFQNSSAKLLR
jgi:hypothetical protein